MDLATQFEIKIVKDFAGYISSADKTNLEPNIIVRGSKNVYKKLSGTWANRPGLKRRGTADSTEADIKSAYVWYTSLAKTIPLRVCNSKLQFESDIVTTGTYVWYDLMTSLTLTRFVFDTWWDNTGKKDKLLYVIGDSNIYSWEGGIAKFVSTGSNATTLTLDRTAASAGFNTSSGTVIIDGTEYTYTGSSGSTLTGSGWDFTGKTTNMVVYSKPVTNTNKPASTFTNDFIKVNNNQVYCGSYTSRLVYVSTQSDFTDYSTAATPRAVGNYFLLTLDSTPTGFAVRQGNMHIGAGTSDWYIIKLVQTTVAAAITETVTVEKKRVAHLQAPLAHEFIDVVGDTIIYLSQDQQLRTYGDFRNIFQPTFPCLSQAVFTELSEEDFTGGALKALGDFIYITAPVNGKVYLHQTRLAVDAVGNVTAERLWHPYQVWNATRIDEIDGVVYAFSNANPQVYQVWDTLQWHDDSPSDEPIPYDSVLRFAYNSHGRRQGLISFDKLFTEGYISQGTELNAYVLYEYQGSGGMTNPTINSVATPTTFFIGSIAPAIGDAPIGDNPLGDGLTEESADQELLPKFKSIKSLSLTNCSEYQIVYYSSVVDSRWEVLAYGTNAHLVEEQQATNLVS